MNIEELKKKYDIRIDELEEFIRIQVKEDESKEFYQELMECIKNIKGKVSIANGIVENATVEEFLQGEKIIQEVVEGINPNWSEKQKVAFVHYKIGKLISYVPDFKFSGRFANSPMSMSSRNIWKSVVDGKSVCNGIVSITRNILSRVGVRTRELSSGTHSFLLVEMEEGNIITDPTWDLKNSLYGARPMYFGKTYEQLREQERGISNAHKLETLPENVIEISEQELREIYHSLAYTKEDRKFFFPILDKVTEVKSNRYENTIEKLNAFFTMFTRDFPKEAMHLTETRTILESCLYELGIEPKGLITKFIYDKKDEKCQSPYLSLLIDSKTGQQPMVYYLDLETMQFKSITINELEDKFKSHNLDTVEPFWKKYLPVEERKSEVLQK